MSMHPVSLFCWGYRLGMKILCKRNVPYVPGCMLFGQSRTKPAERRRSSAFGHQTLLISYHRINYIENVTVNCIDGNGMRGVPLRCPAILYSIRIIIRFMSSISLALNLLYEEEYYEKRKG